MKLMKPESTLVFYHKDCHDGTASAAVAKMAIGPAARYLPIDYNGETFDKHLFSTWNIEHVIFVDYCPKLNNLEKLLEKFSVTIIDHHKSAEKMLADIEHENLTKVFDMNKSGALLTWNYFYPDRVIPYQVTLVSDRDLFKFKYGEDTYAAYCYMKTLNYDINKVKNFILLGKEELENVLESGKAMLAYHQASVETFAERVASWFNADDIQIPMLNLPREFGSDTCAHFLKKWKSEKVVGYFSFGNNSVTFGLRSRTAEECDVSIIAEKFGGGGHACASGFSLTIKEAIERMDIEYADV